MGRQKYHYEYAKQLGLTEAQYEEMCEAADTTWDIIGADCLDAVASEAGEPRESGTMSRDDVIDIVMDANHITSHNRDLSVEVKTLLDAYTHSAIIKQALRADVFKCSLYGY
jgi:hypothetical protein